MVRVQAFSTSHLTQVLTSITTPVMYVRQRTNDIWGAWAPMHTTYITPSDTVLLNAPTERSANGGTLKTFRVTRAGLYRLKWEMRSSSGGTLAAFDLRLGIASAANLTADQISSVSFQTSSATYAAFSYDFTIPLPANCTLVMYGLSGSASIFVRNVTLCGSETYVNPATDSVID
jgi:hypothetical protein